MTHWDRERSHRETARRKEPSLRGVDLADVHPAPRRKKPEWDAPVNNPSVWVFAVVVIAIIAIVFGALELAEWIGRTVGRMSVTTGWIVEVTQSQRRCDGRKKNGQQCANTGHYGWRDGRYCTAHHPNWNAWFEEQQRMQRIASAAALPAIAKAERG